MLAGQIAVMVSFRLPETFDWLLCRHQVYMDLPSTGECRRGIQQVFANAVRCHQAGQLNQAERLYRQILAVVPHHADSLHLLGAIAYQVGRHDLAVDMIGKAIAINC